MQLKALFRNEQKSMHRVIDHFFDQLQPCSTASIKKSDVIPNNNKASTSSTQVIQQKDGTLFSQVFI